MPSKHRFSFILINFTVTIYFIYDCLSKTKLVLLLSNVTVHSRYKLPKLILLYCLENNVHYYSSLSSPVRIVHLCRRRSDGAFVILKEIPVEQMSRDERLAAQNECQVLKLLNHPNIIEYYENFLEDKALMIAMEYAPGDLTVISYYITPLCSLYGNSHFPWFNAVGHHTICHSHVRPGNTTWWNQSTWCCCRG